MPAAASAKSAPARSGAPSVLTDRLNENVRKAKLSRGTPPAPAVALASLADLSDDLRVLIYGLGVAVAVVDGVTRGETRALREVADVLNVPADTTRIIQKTLLQAPSTGARIVALIDAYRQASGRSPSRAAAPDPIEQVRDRAEERAFGLPVLDAEQVSQFLGSRSQNQRQYAAALRRRGELLGLPRGNRFVYPKFQFDPKTQQVHRVIGVVGEILHAGSDPWGAVSWWTSPNPRLPDRRAPMDLLGGADADTDLPSLARAVVDTVG
jgi:hypothetical protein